MLDPSAASLSELVARFEQRLRSAFWSWSEPLRRRSALLNDLLTRLSHVTKRPAMRRRRMLRFALPDPGAVRDKIRRARLRLPSSAGRVDVSIIIPAWNHFEYTYACLESIADNTTGAYEVIVVDDCSTDITAEMLRGVGGVRVMRNERNLGFIAGCNRGAAAARGDFLVFLNNDTLVRPGWLAELRDTFRAEPTAGLVGAKLVYADGRLQEAGGIVWRDATAWNFGRLGDPDHPAFNYLRRADYCSGACIMIPRTVFADLGGFDAHFAPAYFEDTDLAFRVRRAGFEVFYQPLAEIVHFEGISSGTDVTTGVKRHQVVNQEKFRDRWVAHLTEHRPNAEAPLLEKDRGVARRILVVDAVTPQPDHDSGSLRMYNLLQVLRELSFKVVFAPSNLARVETYTAALQRRGVETLYRPFVSSIVSHLRRHGAEYDVILLSRAEIADQFMDAARRFAPQASIIFDTVDLHFLREEREARLRGDPALLRHARVRREQELRLVKRADCTLVVSEVEKKLLESASPGALIRVVSNIHEAVGCSAPFGERADLLFLGGFRHPPNIDAVEYFVAEIFPEVRRRLPGVKLRIVGSAPPSEIRRLAGPGILVEGHVPDLGPSFRECRVMVAPLRYGAGVKGKINMSLAHGVPVVATPIAVEGMHLTPGVDVVVAHDPGSFADAVVELYHDEARWRRLSEAGLVHTERYFSFAVARDTIEDAIDEMRDARSVSPQDRGTDGEKAD